MVPECVRENRELSSQELADVGYTNLMDLFGLGGCVRFGLFWCGLVCFGVNPRYRKSGYNKTVHS